MPFFLIFLISFFHLLSILSHFANAISFRSSSSLLCCLLAFFFFPIRVLHVKSQKEQTRKSSCHSLKIGQHSHMKRKRRRNEVQTEISTLKFSGLKYKRVHYVQEEKERLEKNYRLLLLLLLLLLLQVKVLGQ